jgi:multiple sugar transport system substrate-binding protein
MTFEYSRRDFLAGVLATGTLAALGTYFAPGGRPGPSITLRLVTGRDLTGARDLLISQWNRANPRARVDVEVVTGSTVDQRDAMRSRVTSGNADILNLDIINIPYFASHGHIAPIELQGVDEFLPSTLVASKLGDPDATQHWAAPFNTDVGMLFRRVESDPATADTAEPTLATVIDGLAPDGSHQFAGQLRPLSSSAEEAFAVNILEHALSRDENILQGDNGMPARELEAWQRALQPLQAAVGAERILLCDSEEDTRDKFHTQSPTYMRNWPVKYRELQQMNDLDVARSRIRVGPLPIGILGGQSLAVATTSTEASRATEFIHYLASEESQKVLASYGIAATRKGAYSDPNLKAFIPHLEQLRGAVEQARPRPICPRYPEFSAAFVPHMKRLLEQGMDLTTRFVEDIHNALGCNQG